MRIVVCLVAVYLGSSYLLPADPILTATSTCSALSGSSGPPVFTESYSITITGTGNNIAITGLDCGTPYGTVQFTSSYSATLFALPFGLTSFSLDSGVQVSSTNAQSPLHASITLQLSNQQTFIATLLGPPVFPGGLLFYSYDANTSGPFPFEGDLENTHASISGSFGCAPGITGCENYYPITFGQPFTLNQTLNMTYQTIPGTAIGSGVQQLQIETIGVGDLQMDQFPVVITAVPEPRSAALAGVRPDCRVIVPPSSPVSGAMTNSTR